MYLLDTNIISFLMKGQNPELVSKITSCSRNQVFVSHISICEISYGISKLPDSKKKKLLAKRFKEILKVFSVLEWTTPSSVLFGTLKAQLQKKKMQIEDFDVLIAASALANDFVLVTNNIKHFNRIDSLKLEDWS